MKHLGNGEGFTTLILNDLEARMVYRALSMAPFVKGPRGEDFDLLGCWNRGIQRATDRIKAEFDQEQKARKDAKK